MERGPGALTHRIQQIFFGFVAVMFVLIAVSIVPALSSRDRISNLRDRWLPARAASFRLSTSFVDQETGERGFVITSDSRFLDPYRSGSLTSKRLFRQLEHLLQSDSVGTGRLAAVEQRYRIWKRRSAEPEIAAAGGPTPDLARSIIASGAGRHQFDALRAAAQRTFAGSPHTRTDEACMRRDAARTDAGGTDMPAGGTRIRAGDAALSEGVVAWRQDTTRTRLCRRCARPCEACSNVAPKRAQLRRAARIDLRR